MSMRAVIDGIEREMFERATRGENAFNVGDRVIYRSIDYRDMSQNTSNVWYGAKATVISLDAVRDKAWIAFDDFPNCNDRKSVNRFYADFRELELMD